MFVMPLFDSYPGPVRGPNIDNPRMNPCVAPLDLLPENILFIIPLFDILAHENLVTFQRLKRELRPSSDRRIEAETFEGCFHGWIESKLSPSLCCKSLSVLMILILVPDFAIKPETRTRALNISIDFIKDINRKHGFVWSSD